MFRIYALLSLFALGLLGFVIWQGYRLDPIHREVFLNGHVIPALGAVLLVCFLHSMAMFFFMGTAKPIREALPYLEDAEGLGTEAAGIRGSGFKWAGIGIVAAMAVALLGGAADMARIDPRFHEWAAWIGSFVMALTLWKEMVCVARTIDLIREINQRIEQESNGE